MSPRFEIRLTILCLVISAAAGAMFLSVSLDTVLESVAAGRNRFAVEAAIFGVIGTFLVYGNVAYQLSRLGYMRRVWRHHGSARARQSDAHLDEPAEPLTILVPTYQEEPAVVRQTLLSAALQPHPGRRVLLLIDDSPTPRSSHDSKLLNAARLLPAEIENTLAEAAAWTEAAAREIGDVGRLDQTGRRRAAARLAGCFERAAAFLDGFARREVVRNHTDALFVGEILRAPAAEHRARAVQLREAARAIEAPDTVLLRRHCALLAALFRVDLGAFERKRYVNLSHEPNKAMNLNSYIALLGGRWREVRGQDGVHLEPAGSGSADFVVPAATYLVTLDADSLLLPGYLTRLIALMSAPGNERIAVAQTPYSAVPGAEEELERIAGATTDMQYIVHQGFTSYGATFWVGANALLRTAALQDIVTVEDERGIPIRRYIQDRTVIEDTESSIDLRDHGWQLINYPARLSYSATPSDFGSLLIQRRRWANGGLIILPKLIRQLAGSLRGRGVALAEGVLRAHYLISIATTNLALLLLLAYPFSDAVVSAWLPLAALPYIVLYTRDLRQAGYRLLDVLRVYALNLLLLPVNLAGVAKSLEQAWTGRKIPFGRTPKVEGRTAIPALYLLAPMALLAFWVAGSVNDYFAGRSMHALFAGMNAALLAYAVWRYVGWRALVGDVRAQLPVLTPSRDGQRASG